MDCAECGEEVEYKPGERVTAMVDHFEDEHGLCE